MNRIVKQNIVFSIAVIVVLIISNFMQSLALPMGVIGLMRAAPILVILNGLELASFPIKRHRCTGYE